MKARKIVLPLVFAGATALVVAGSIREAAASVSAARASASLVGADQRGARAFEIVVWPKQRNNNTINLKQSKQLEVALVAQLGFEFSEIDPQTVEFAGAIPAKAGTTSFDANQDGMADRVYYFIPNQLKLTAADTLACLTAKLVTQIDIKGCTAVKVTTGAP